MPVNISINTNTIAIQENINHISVNDPNNPNIVDITQPITEIVEIITPGPQGPIGPSGSVGPPGTAILSGGTNDFIPLWSGSTSLTSSIAKQASGTLQISGSTSITGSLSVTNGITGSLFGTSSNSTSASYALNSTSASYALSSSYSNTSTSASYALNSTSSSYALNSTSASYAATASNILGGKATHLPFFITDTTLATSSIYQSGSTSIIINQDNNTTANPEALYVWQPHPTSFNVISGKGNVNNYLQLNIQNTNQGTNASSDVVATADNGNEVSNYIDMGINNENFSGPIGGPNDAYLYSAGQHLHIGNITPDKPIQFFVGGADSNVDRKFELNANGQHNMTGSLEISGSLKVNQGITGSLFGSASYSLSSSQAISSSYATTASYVLQAVSSSYTNNALSASYALTASYALNAGTTINTGSFVTTSSFNSFTSSYNTGSFTGSFKGTLTGTASLALNANSSLTSTSASHADSADFSLNSTSASHAIQADNAAVATYANTAGNGGVTNIVAGSGIVLPFGGTGAVTIVSSGGGGVTIISGSAITSSFVNLNTWTFNHNLGTRTPTITVFDSDYNQIIPQNIQLVSTSSATITFPTQESGFAIASTGGTTGTALSSSYSLFATYADSASYYPETDPIFVAKSGSLATTGSNIFIGNQTITGSVYISSGSSLNLNGNTLYSSASTLFTNANIVPTQHNTQSLGTTTERWKDIWLGGGSIYIADTVIPNSDLIIESINNIFTISGSAGLEVGSFKFIDNELFLKNEAIPIIIGSGSSTAPVELKRPLQIVSGETGNITFNATREGRIQIISPNIPANDIGAFSIIGNASGSYQPIINPSGMIHVTSNDAQAARVTVDGFGTTIGAIYVGRHARGTAALPTPTLSGDTLVRFAGLGYATSSYFPVVGAVPTSLEFQATENYSTSSYGSRAAFYTYANGAVSRSLSAIIDATGITIPSSSLLFGTASWALNAQTASYVTSSNIVGTVLSSSYALTASYAKDYVLTSATSSMLAPYVLTSITSSMSVATASYVKNAQTASYYIETDPIFTAKSGSFATTGSNTFGGNQTISGSITTSGSLTVNGPAIFNDQTVQITGSLLITGSGFINSKPILTSANTSSFENGFGWYGAFCSTGSQTNPVANISRSMQLDTVEHSNGVSLVSGSRITFQHGGVYNIQFSAQLQSTSAGDNLINIWFKKNGSNVARSNTLVNVAKQAGDKVVAAWNYIDTANANEYYEIAWQSADTTMQLHAAAATGNLPQTPSVIITATQVG